MKVQPNELGLILALLGRGESSREIAKKTGRSKSTVNDIRKKHLDDKIQELYPTHPTNGPRVLFLDVESTPSVVVTFGRFGVNINQESVLQEGGWLLSIAWEWMNVDKKPQGIRLNTEEVEFSDDSRLLMKLGNLVEEADILIIQNGKKFDIPLINARRAVIGLPPLKPVPVIDTLNIAKKMKFNSNKLDSLGAQLGVGRKVDTGGIDLWVRCMKGDEKALDTMLKYNIEDITLLKNVYMKIRAFDENPVNFGHFYNDDKHRCPVCGSDDIHETGNLVHTAVSSFPETICGDCGHRSKKRNNMKSAEKRKTLLTKIR